MFQNDSDCAKPLIVAGKLNQRILVISVLSVLFLSVAAVFIFSRLRPISQPREVMLPDGGVVRIEALTFGSEHSFSTEPIRQKLWRWLPKLSQRFLGRPVSSGKMRTAPDSLVIWMRLMDPSSGTVYPEQEWHYTSDRHGCKFQCSHRTSTGIRGSKIIGVACDNFPRGDDTFDYFIADKDGKTLARFKLTNPFKITPKHWIPEALPTTKTNGDLVVELRRLARVYSSNPQMPFDPEIQVLQPAEPRFWEKPLIQIFDPLGNCCPGSFCTNETLWKVEANYFRTRDSQFRPDQTWVLTKISTPQKNGTVRLLQTNTIQGARVGLVSLRTTPEDALFLTTWTHQPYGDLQIYVRARDDVGRELVARAHGSGLRVFGEGQQQFEIHPLEDSKSLDLEVIVQRPVRFEFYVDQKPKFAPRW